MTEARIKSNIVIVWLHELVSLVFEQEKRGKKINGERERQQMRSWKASYEVLAAVASLHPCLFGLLSCVSGPRRRPALHVLDLSSLLSAGTDSRVVVLASPLDTGCLSLFPLGSSPSAAAAEAASRGIR